VSEEKKEEKNFKSGFVVLVGRSNVGKSTLLNSLVGTKVSITTPKPQTTRQAIQGVLHDERGQIIFVDTPGIFKKVNDRLTAKLTERAKRAMKGVDVVLYVVDPTREIGEEERLIFRLVKNLSIPKILVVNKIDIKDIPYKEDYQEWQDEFDGYLEISALKRKNLKPLIDLIFKYLPKGKPFYPQYQFTSLSNEFWVAELIREKVFLVTGEEIPYKTKVEVEEITLRDNGLLYIKAFIITSEKRHKKMLIGKGGRKIKEIGHLARKELEQVMNKKIYLDLEVKLEKQWQDYLED